MSPLAMEWAMKDLSTTDVAAVLDVSERTVQRWAQEGRIEAKQVGFNREYRFQRSAVEELATQVNLTPDWSKLQ